MAVSGTVPARRTPRFQPHRIALRVRRLTAVLGLTAALWFALRYGARLVPADMDTVPSIPPGSFCLVDRWASGLRVGSDVFVATPVGELLSRVRALDGELVHLEHPNPRTAWSDSSKFGPVPKSQVLGLVLVVFEAGAARGR